jgi:hypothetical protein
MAANHQSLTDDLRKGATMSDLTKYKDAVPSIKNAILQSRYQAARLANREQLMLYYSIGRYVSDNTRSGKWGTGAIEEISRQLQSELPGLRGFSATTMKYMRTFFEKWSEIVQENAELGYFGKLYSSGDIVRISAKEHTGLLERDDREELEDETDDVSKQASLTSEKCLLYVALTRAQKGAYLTSYGTQSEFLAAAQPN